jgi:hypothetical protein
MQVRGKPIKSIDKFYRWICDGKPVCCNTDIGSFHRPTFFYNAEEAKLRPFADIVKEIRSGHWFEVIEFEKQK